MSHSVDGIGRMFSAMGIPNRIEPTEDGTPTLYVPHVGDTLQGVPDDACLQAWENDENGTCAVSVGSTFLADGLQPMEVVGLFTMLRRRT